MVLVTKWNYIIKVHLLNENIYTVNYFNINTSKMWCIISSGEKKSNLKRLLFSLTATSIECANSLFNIQICILWP